MSLDYFELRILKSIYDYPGEYARDEFNHIDLGGREEKNAQKKAREILDLLELEGYIIQSSGTIKLTSFGTSYIREHYSSKHLRELKKQEIKSRIIIEKVVSPEKVGIRLKLEGKSYTGSRERTSSKIEEREEMNADYNVIGRQLLNSHKFLDALLHFKEAKKQYMEKDDFDMVVFTNNYIALVHHKLVDYRSALDTLVETFSLYYNYQGMELRKEHLDKASDLSILCFTEALKKGDIGAPVVSFLEILKYKYVLIPRYEGASDYQRFLFDTTDLKFDMTTVYGIFIRHAGQYLNQIYTIADDRTRSSYYRAFLLNLLGCIPTTNLNVSFLTKYVFSDEIVLRRTAVFALWGQASKSSLDLFRNLLDDNDPFVKGFSIRALGYMKDRSSIDRIQGYMTDTNEFVRDGAREVLENFG